MTPLQRIRVKTGQVAPCPECGPRQLWLQVGGSDPQQACSVQCAGCGLQGEMRRTRKQAFRAWNAAFGGITGWPENTP